MSEISRTSSGGAAYREEEIRSAEQAIRDLEIRYRSTIQELRLKIDRRGPFAVLGKIDGVEVIEVEGGSGRSNEPEKVAQTCVYRDQDYLWATSSIPWYGWSPMMRAVRLNNEGLPHVFGIVQNGNYKPTEIGIYVPSDTLVSSRRRHAEEALRDYPTVSVALDQIRNLNISPDFIRMIVSEVDLAVVDKGQLLRHLVWIKPTANSHDYTYGQDYGWSDEVTRLSIGKLDAPEINYQDFFAGKRDSLLEKIREVIGAEAYNWTAGWSRKERQNDFMFVFNRVLSYKEIADALQKLGNPDDKFYQTTLHRLSDRLRELVNLSLERATPWPLIQSAVNHDFKPDEFFKSEQRPWDWHYLSISMY